MLVPLAKWNTDTKTVPYWSNGVDLYSRQTYMQYTHMNRISALYFTVRFFTGNLMILSSIQGSKNTSINCVCENDRKITLRYCIGKPAMLNKLGVLQFTTQISETGIINK